jgi:hypothetical protein
MARRCPGCGSTLHAARCYDGCMQYIGTVNSTGNVRFNGNDTRLPRIRTVTCEGCGKILLENTEDSLVLNYLRRR